VQKLPPGKYVNRHPRGAECELADRRSLFRLQKLLDMFLERIKGQRPGEEFCRFDLRTTRLGIPEEKRGRAGHASLLALLETGIDLGGVFAAVETGLEGRHVQPKSLGMPPQRLGLELLLLGKQAVMHLPAFALLVRAPERLRGFAGQLVHILQRKILGDILQLSGLNVFFCKLWQRLTDVSGTEGSLIVREFDQREGGLLVTFGEGIRNIERDVDVANGRAIRRAR
jgi:hypothetical protein